MSRSPPHCPGSVIGVVPFFSPSTNRSAPDGVEVTRSSFFASCRMTGVNFSGAFCSRSEEHTSELQSQSNLVCRLLLEKKKKNEKKQDRRRKHKTQHKTRTQCNSSKA